MSKYDGCYVKVDDAPAFWAVDDGKRRLIESMDRVYALGLRDIHVVSPKELRAIPIYKASPKAESDKEK